MQQRIVEMQGPLQEELTEGVANFLKDVLKFDADYEQFGPMTPGLSAREASDRYRKLSVSHLVFIYSVNSIFNNLYVLG